MKLIYGKQASFAFYRASLIVDNSARRPRIETKRGQVRRLHKQGFSESEIAKKMSISKKYVFNCLAA